MKQNEYYVSPTKLEEVKRRCIYYQIDIEGLSDCEIWEKGDFEFEEWCAEELGEKTYEEFHNIEFFPERYWHNPKLGKGERELSNY